MGRSSAGNDALTADRARHGHAADLGEASRRADAELIDDAVPAGLHVQEPAVGRGSRVDGPWIRGGLAQQRKVSRRAVSEA